MNSSKLFVISAPSGCGKGTILSEVFKNTDVYYSVSCTTRDMREGEIDGVHYKFISNEKFESMIENNEFLEHAGFVEKYYGTPKKPVIDCLESGRDVVLEIETLGAFQVKESMPEAVLIFILPPSVKELDRRLHKRATEPDEVINQRVEMAALEISKAYNYDYVIMNDALEDAVREFSLVIDSVKAGTAESEEFKASNEKVKNMIDEVLNNA